MDLRFASLASLLLFLSACATGSNGGVGGGDGVGGATTSSSGTAGGAGTGGAGTGGAGGDPNAPLPYPTRSAYHIKGIQPDFWPDKDAISGNNAGGVAMNAVWANWEPQVKPTPCDPMKEEEYEGRCFVIDPNFDAALPAWTARDIVVTAVVYGVPAWSQITGCSPAFMGGEIFCAPTNPADYGRFVGMLARRYDGKHGHGRIADFVIHNEVNSNDWFDVGCGQGKPCPTDGWVTTYAESYKAAYDAVMKEQSTAKVLISLDHHFGASLDKPSATNPILSGETFLKSFASKIGNREWRVAFHPYPPDLLAPDFSPDDYPKVTYGNIGVLAGFLRKTFPNKPFTWEIQLTESGINSLSPSTPTAQADQLCKSFRNVLGTPGIESYIYHRMKDHPTEVAAGLGVGLHDENGMAKPSWAVWALANRNDTSPQQLSCGFDDLPYTRLWRGYEPTRGHWASTRALPPGFNSEQSWKLLRDEAPDTVMLYECGITLHNFVSKDVSCGGQTTLGPLGYIYTKPAPGTVPLYQCRTGVADDHFVSSASNCEGKISDGIIGYALP